MLVIDLETTGLCPFGYDDIVLAGYKELDGEVIITTEPDLDFIFSHRVLVGHNIKFDLHFLRWLDSKRYEDWLHNGGLVYDTQVAEYMLTGQEHIYPSLDEVSAKYGGTQKDTRVKEMFEAGMSSSAIPNELLEKYLIEDVKNTEIVYRAQRKYDDDDFWKLVVIHMKFLLFLETCEFNGMAIDYQRNEEIINELSEQCQILMDDIHYICGFAFNPASANHIASWLYGGSVVIRERRPNGVYKTGKRKGETKYNWFETVHKLKARTKKKPKKTKKGHILTDAKVLESFEDDTLIKKVLELRAMKKLLETYHINIREMSIDDILHCNLNQCATKTGRLSSSEPNLQNVPR